MAIAAAKEIGALRNGIATAVAARPSPLSWAKRVAATPPLYSVTAAMIAGDAAGNLGLELPLWIAAALAIAAAVLMTARRTATGLIVALIAIAAAATIPSWRLLNPAIGPASLARFPDGAMITIVGRVAREPRHVGGDRAYLFVATGQAGAAGEVLGASRGLVRVTILGDAERFRLGDEIRATGRIRFPRNDGNPGEFDYRAWLMRQGIAATMFAGAAKTGAPAPIQLLGRHPRFPATMIETARRRIGALIDANLGYPANAEMRALIIGDRGGIDEALRRRFAFTGMAHLLVISGLHLGIVATAAFFVGRLAMGFFPTLMARGYANKVAALAAAIAASGYAAIAGHHVSTVRALVMVLAYALAILLDRARELMASLALAALVICLGMPGSTADIGFQLSFVSVAAIVLGMRRFAAWRRMRFAAAEENFMFKLAETVAGYFAVSFWALLGAAPLAAFYFNQFSIVGLAANAIVVPIMGFGAVVTGLVAAALDGVNRVAAGGATRLAGDFATLGTRLAGWFYRWPFGWSRIFTPTVPEMAIAYGLIALWLTAPLADAALPDAAHVRTREANAGARAPSPWRRRAAALMLAALALDAGWWTWRRYFNDELRITFLSVGEGDAAVVRFPGSRVMLIDGGGGFRGGFDPGERMVAPYLWEHRIMRVDYALLSHPDRDHFGGLIFLVANFRPKEFWTSGVGSDDASYARLIAVAQSAGARQLVCGGGAPARTIGGVEVRCLWPRPGAVEKKENNASMVVRMRYGGAAVLFTGDLEAKGERELIATGVDLRAAVIKVPHHGSATSSSAELIAAVRPGLAAISDGYLNRFGFPDPGVVERYRAAGATVLRTDRDGAVRVAIGGEGVTASTDRRGPVRLAVDDSGGAVGK